MCIRDSCCFIAPLSWQTALDRTPAPTYRTPIISNRPWIVPSSPNGPCSSANATSMGVRPTRESPSTRATSAPDAVRMSTASGADVARVDGDSLVGRTPIDVAFALLHGPFGEDGTIQGPVSYTHLR